MALPGVGLGARIFLSSAGIVTVVLGVALVVLSRSAQQTAHTSVARGLGITQQRVAELVASERAQLASRLGVYAENPEYRSNFEAGQDDGDFLDYAQVAAEQVGAEWVQLIDRDGIRLAKSDDPSAERVEVASPLVLQALGGQMAEGFGVAGDTALIHVVASPIPGAGNRVIGALMAARHVSDSVARAVGSTTQSELFFFVIDGEGVPRVAGMTDRLRDVGASRLAVLAGNVGIAPPGRGGDEADTAVRQAGAPAASPFQEAEFNGERWVGDGALLLAASGAPVGGFVALRSLDRELDALGYSRLRNTLLAVGAAGLLVAIVVAGVTSRQIVRPVTLLADATRRASEGDYQAEIPEGGRGEIGILASAFRRLLTDLRDKQALVDFLSVASPGAARTLAMNAVTPTMQAQMGGETLIEAGQLFGNRYEIKGVLGVGGMGMVYKANDRELGETLAIKTLKPEMMSMDTGALERFKSEIRLARRIAHRNVVRTYDLGEFSGVYYITMEYVEGKSLKDLITERGRLPASAVLPIAKQLCRALEVSHEEGVIHRDIKPQNMVVQSDGVLKVMDFGIARLATRPAESGHTQAGMVVGTPAYMAPEQLLGDELDARADLYATGCVLYECLTGKVPHEADAPFALISKVLEEVPAAPSALHADIPPALSDLVMWALQKDRERRPPSAAALYARLDAIVVHP
ncbi:MAG: protein kinase [Gemmatimonadaceae bacterium]